MTELTDEDLQRKVTRASLATRMFILFVGITLSLTLLFTAYLVHQIRSQQVQSKGTLVSANAAAERAQATVDAIHSCVTPGEPCYERSQKQTAEAVGNINRVVVLASACAVGKTGTELQIENAIQACVIRGLARDNAKGE